MARSRVSMPKLGNLIPEDILDHATRLQEFHKALSANTRDRIGNSEYLKTLVEVTIYAAKLAERIKNTAEYEQEHALRTVNDRTEDTFAVLRRIDRRCDNLSQGLQIHSVSITPAEIERIITKAARDAIRNALFAVDITSPDLDNNNTTAPDPEKLKLHITIPDNSTAASLRIYTEKGAHIYELINQYLAEQGLYITVVAAR
jgi:hypothetical protein